MHTCSEDCEFGRSLGGINAVDCKDLQPLNAKVKAMDDHGSMQRCFPLHHPLFSPVPCSPPLSLSLLSPFPPNSRYFSSSTCSSCSMPVAMAVAAVLVTASSSTSCSSPALPTRRTSSNSCHRTSCWRSPAKAHTPTS